MKEIEISKIGKLIIKIFSVLFSIFFTIVLFNTIFFNMTINILYSIPIMIIATLTVYSIILFIYHTYKHKNLKILEYTPNKFHIIGIVIITFILQLILAKLTYARYDWDCGLVMESAYSLIKNGTVDTLYFSSYSNNIGILLVFKYILTISNLIVGITDISNAFFATTIFNIIMVDIASIFTLLTIKKILGNKSAYFSLIFMIPLIIFSPYIIVPYTDTITMAFPIMFLYFYIVIKELKKQSIEKYILITLEGILLTIGTFLKPTVLIMPIAIVIIEILNAKIKIINNKKFIQNLKYPAIVLILFIIGCSLSYFAYSKLKQNNLEPLISQEEYDNNSIPYTHFLMMGMQERKVDNKSDGKNQTTFGGFNGNDVINTRNVTGYENKKAYNLEIIKERLNNFGILGYIKFLYNKSNWILSDGTFYYGGEGSWRISEYYNQSAVAKNVQKYIDHTSKEFKNITANIMQVSWILITIGLIFSLNKNEKNYICISKLAIFGLILFVLLFEGRARYLINYLPIFILVGVQGLNNSLKFFHNKLITTKNAKQKI